MNPDGCDVDRIGSVVLDLDPQAADVHVDDLQLAVIVPAPDRRENILPGQGPARILHEQLHNGILHLGQPDLLTALFQGAVPGVEHKGPLPDLLRGGAGLSADAPVQGVYPGRKLRRGEGLCHIVVRTGHQARNLVHFLGPGGEHDNADGLVGGPHRAADLESVHARQIDVKNGNARIRILPELVQSVLSGTGLDHIVPGPLKIDDHKAADTDLIFQNQYFFHRTTPLSFISFARWLSFPVPSPRGYSGTSPRSPPGWRSLPIPPPPPASPQRSSHCR